MEGRSVEPKHIKSDQPAPVELASPELSIADRDESQRGTAEEPHEPPEYLTVWNLTDILGVSRNTVYRLLKRGELPFIRTGCRSIRVHREALEAWRRGQEETNTKKVGAQESKNTVRQNMKKGPAIHANDKPDLDPKGSTVGSIPE